MKDSYWMAEEIFIGAVLQSPLYFIVGWWVLPIMLACGLLWRYGGWSRGHKIARWAVVPLLVCFSAILCGASWWTILASPFMVKLMPMSYGKSGWLWKWLRNDFLVRMICMGWYWLTFVLAYSIPRI